MQESEMIKGCILGNRTAQHELYLRFSPRVFGICKRYMKDRERAEEMTMNTFLSVFSNISGYVEKGSFEAWISRISVNVCLSELRKKTSFTHEVEMPVLSDMAHLTQVSDFEEDVEKILSVLPESARVIFNLFVMEDYKHQEIAKMLGISEGTSKSQLHYAKERIRSYFPQFQSKKASQL